MDRRKRRSDGTDPLETYRRIRKPMPPPERVLPDKRRKVAEREADREAREGRADPRAGGAAGAAGEGGRGPGVNPGFVE